MIRRIDLRGASVPTTAPWCPVPRSTSSRPRRRAADLRRRTSSRGRGDHRVHREVRPRRAVRHRRPRGGAAHALEELDPAIRAGLEESISRLRTTCEAELEQDVTTQVVPGGTVNQRMVPIERVGLYVPGGIAPLVSRVVMNVVPAQVAGSSPSRSRPRRRRAPGCRTRRSWRPARCSVSTRCTPSVGPRPSRCSPTAGPCRKVDLVTGPGNIYTVSRSGCSRASSASTPRPVGRIAILADDTADPAYVAADLLSQAEHDPMAAAVLVTTSPTLADEVEAELDKQVSVTRRIERIRVAVRGAVRHRAGRRPRPGARGRGRLRRRAPGDPDPRRVELARRVRNAGAIFVGSSPRCRSCDDCCRRSNHVLPTGGCACHSSSSRCGRSARTPSSVDEQALRDVAPHVVTLAEAEDLPGHGAAVRVRVEER